MDDVAGASTHTILRLAEPGLNHVHAELIWESAWRTVKMSFARSHCKLLGLRMAAVGEKDVSARNP